MIVNKKEALEKCLQHWEIIAEPGFIQKHQHNVKYAAIQKIDSNYFIDDVLNDCFACEYACKAYGKTGMAEGTTFCVCCPLYYNNTQHAMCERDGEPYAKWKIAMNQYRFDSATKRAVAFCEWITRKINENKFIRIYKGETK